MRGRKPIRPNTGVAGLVEILALPFAMLCLGAPLAPLVAIVGLFWHPYKLPTGLNAIALGGTFLGLALLGLVVSQGLSRLAAQIKQEERPETTLDEASHSAELDRDRKTA